MKKIVCLLLVVMMCLSACGGETTDPTTPTPDKGNVENPGTTNGPTDAPTDPQNPTGPAQPAGFVFVYNGTEIPMNVNAAPILEKLGQPKTYTEETSCAFEGLDKTYFYGSFYLQTYPKGTEDFVYCVWIVDDSVTTAEGIYIGATQAEVEQAYGKDGYNGTNAYLITSGGSKLTIIMKDGVVSSIQYDAIVE